MEPLSSWLTGDDISIQEGSCEGECICGLILLMNVMSLTTRMVATDPGAEETMPQSKPEGRADNLHCLTWQPCHQMVSLSNTLDPVYSLLLLPPQPPHQRNSKLRACSIASSGRYCLPQIPACAHLPFAPHLLPSSWTNCVVQSPCPHYGHTTYSSTPAFSIVIPCGP